MNINDFSDLTLFISQEYEKLAESYGIQRVPDKIVRDIEKTLIQYKKLYNKPLYLKAKRDLALQEAIETMPHGFIWKFFHPGLWAKIKEVLSEEKNTNEDGQKTTKENVIVGVVSTPAVYSSLPPEEID